MPVISLAGLNWVHHHNLRIDDLPRRSVRRTNGDWVIDKRSIDAEDNGHDNPSSDTLTWRGDFWLLNQSFGPVRYVEALTRHGKLTIRGNMPSDTVINSIAYSPCSIDDVVELPAACFAAASNGKVIRAKNLNNGTVELLMRIDWMGTRGAWDAEQA